jgi:sialic acid synthase SpsE
VVVSTAMCTMAEVHDAVRVLRAGGAADLVVMQCTGNYPASLADSNLRVLPTYRAELQCLVGYSDHTPEQINPVAATALGACMYEKHFTLDRAMPGPDHRMSLEPAELRATISAIRQTEQALGSSSKQVLPSEAENRAKLRKSLVAATAIPAGMPMTEAMLAAKRPGTGLAPARFQSLIGRRLRVAVDADTVLTEEMLEP